MAKMIYGSLGIRDASSVKFFDANSSNFIGLKAATNVTADLTFTLPAADGTSGQAIVTNASGVLSFATFLSAALSTANVFIGNGSNVATATDTSSVGDILADSTNGLTIKSGVISNTHINASAAIAYSKLAALTASRALASDGSGFVSASSVTSTELGYVSGVTSSIQTQFTGKASTALNNLTVSSLATGSLLVGSSSSAVSNLAIGSTGQVLTVSGGTAVWATPAVTSYATNWITADTASKTVTHSLGTLDVIVQIFDKTDGSSIEVDSVVRTDTNTLDLTASSAPGAAGWRVLVKAL